MTDIIEERSNLPAPLPTSGERNLIFASPECGELFGALAEAQGKMENPKKTKTASVKGTTKEGKSYSYDYKYAPMEEVIDVIRAPMSAAGLIYRQFLAQRDGNWVMRTVIAHRSGQWYGCDYPLFAYKPGAQGFASGVTYARRYGLMLALGLVGEDDDDANVADGHPVTTVYAKEPASRAGASPPPRKTATAPNSDPFAEPSMPKGKAIPEPVDPDRKAKHDRAVAIRDRVRAAIEKAAEPKAVDGILQVNAADLAFVKSFHEPSFDALLQLATARSNELLASA